MKVFSPRLIFLLPISILLLGGCKSDRLEPWRPDESFYADSAPPEPTPGVPEEEPTVVPVAEKPPRRFSFFRRASAPEPVEPGPAAEGEGNPGDAPPSPEPPAEPARVVYRLKIGDTLFITLSGPVGVSEQIETLVDDRGDVKLRYIGSVHAEGRTATELEREIEAEYTERQNIYKEIYARVAVPNTFYFIGGEVRQPGRFPLVGRVTLSQAIVSAGNFTEWANSRRIVLVRNNERLEINFRDIRNDPSLDVDLRAGDVITVERSTL